MSHTKKLFTLYKAEHPTLGTYIGVTSTSLAKRREAHMNHAFNGCPYPLQVALTQSRSADWKWTVLRRILTDRKGALLAENEAIKKHQPSLNVNLEDGKVREGYRRFNKGGTRPPASEELREWFSTFHSARPRKRKFCRQTMLDLSSQGQRMSEIARTLGCTLSLVHNVLSGKYKV